MIKRYLLDTHTLFWYLTASSKLSSKAKGIIDDALKGDASIIISVISLAELYYLNEKVGSPLRFLDEYKRLEEMFDIIPLEPSDILLFTELQEIKEMHDRIITSLALKYKATLITKDREITLSNKVRVLW